jgi:hypothetical protein
MSINLETAFDDAGVNAIVGVKFLDLLGLSNGDLQIPGRFSRFQDVISYMKKFPEDTQRFLVTKATRGKMVDKLNHVWEYVNLLKEKEGLDRELAITQEKISGLDGMGDLNQLQDEIALESELMSKVESLKAEIKIYE